MDKKVKKKIEQNLKILFDYIKIYQRKTQLNS